MVAALAVPFVELEPEADRSANEVLAFKYVLHRLRIAVAMGTHFAASGLTFNKAFDHFLSEALVSKPRGNHTDLKINEWNSFIGDVLDAVHEPNRFPFEFCDLKFRFFGRMPQPLAPYIQGSDQADEERDITSAGQIIFVERTVVQGAVCQQLEDEGNVKNTCRAND